jgi:hypothetical protein
MRIDSTRTNSTSRLHALYGLLAAAASALVVFGCSDADGTGGSGTQGTTSTSGGGSDGSGGSGMGGSSGTAGGGTGGMGGMGGTGGTGGMQPNPDAGWTDFPASADTLKVYVSSSGGNDNNDGLTEATAVKTIAKGKSIIRAGMPDHLLLKRGDVWNEALGTWSKSGKSAAEPLVVSTYGEAVARPLLKTGNKGALYAAPNTTVNYVAFVGLDMYAHTRDPNSPDFVGPEGEEGIRWLAKTDGLHFEDMYVHFYEGPNFTIQGTVPNTNSITNVKLRRSIIADSYNTTGHSQGIYAQQVTNLLIEDNLFDHNGWNEKVSGAQKTIFNHNMYINHTCDNLTVKGNISVRAGSHGLQARPGGLVTENLFVDDPIAMSFGLVLGDSSPKAGGVTGEISDNVFLSSADIEPEALPRGFGLQIGNIQSAIIENNIIAHDKSAKPYGNAIEFFDNGVGVHNLTVQNNIIYDWRGNLRFNSTSYLAVLIKANHVQAPNDATTLVTFAGGIPSEVTFQDNIWTSGADPAKWFTIGGANKGFAQWTADSGETGGMSKVVKYASPELKISDYHASLGKAADFFVFLAEARKQSRKNYLYEYTTAAPLAFIRDGFKVVP